jgi:hypothetical protein
VADGPGVGAAAELLGEGVDIGDAAGLADGLVVVQAATTSTTNETRTRNARGCRSIICSLLAREK